MTDLEILLKKTVNTIDSKNEYDKVDWDSKTAKVMKMVYQDYEIINSDNFNTCPSCDNLTNKVLHNKHTKEIVSNYCNQCIILFK